MIYFDYVKKVHPIFKTLEANAAASHDKHTKFAAAYVVVPSPSNSVGDYGSMYKPQRYSIEAFGQNRLLPRITPDNTADVLERPMKYLFMRHAEDVLLDNIDTIPESPEGYDKTHQIWVNGLSCPKCLYAMLTKGFRVFHMMNTQARMLDGMVFEDYARILAEPYSTTRQYVRFIITNPE